MSESIIPWIPSCITKLRMNFSELVRKSWTRKTSIETDKNQWADDQQGHIVGAGLANTYAPNLVDV